MRKLLHSPITFILIALSLVFTANAQVADNILAQQLVTRNAESIGLSKNDLGNHIVSSSYFNETGGTQMVYLNQSYKGLPVYNQILVLAFKDGKLISKTGSFLPDMEALSHGASASASVTPADAVRTSIADAKVNVPAMIVPLITLENGRKYNFGKLNIAVEDVTAELMWVPVDDGKNITGVKLAWQVALYLDKLPDYWNTRVDAITNTVVNKNSLTVFENFDQYRTPIRMPGFMMAAQQKTFGNAGGKTPLPLSPSLVGTANYTVIPYPAESPIHPGGAAAVRTNPWTLAGGNAVSLGWHNDGTSDYTTSRGNNVYAQEDRDANNTTFGLTANSTTTPDPLNFTYAGQPDYTVAPPTAGFQQFALTNLFYWNNLAHDITYNFGFTELAGNFQNNNQGRGGAQADYVIADGQDASGSNNANMSTPPDGGRPRMQMFLWDPVRSATTMIVNTPPVIAGPYTAVEGAFSTANLLANVGPVTNQVVWYNDDAAGNTHYACNAPANSVSGKIALINRGFGGAVCTATVPFTTKVKNAQDAGAVAVIMVNNVPGAPVVMGGGPDNTIIIPAVMISDVDGALIAAQLTNNVNVTLSGTPAGTLQIDGDIDNGVIAHEFFHGVSNRLTGGPATTSCLNNAEQAGEGWSDYLALMITTNWATATINDGFNVKRPIGNYAAGYSTSGPGIRPYPYCTNLAINPLTYSDLPVAVIPHGVGTVFCTALWEMTWQLIQTAGISANMFDASGTGGNIIAFKLMMEGLKLQPCSPGFIDARNAILLADVNLYGGAHTCAIWTAFAKRGMGFSAVQGSSNSTTDGTAAFDMPPACSVVGPNVTINQAAAQADPTATSPINFTVVFDQVVTGFATGDVTITGTASAGTVGTVTGSGTTYNVAVSGMTTCGTIIVNIPAGVAQNAAAQTNNASTSTDNTVTYTAGASPTVTINQAAAQPDPTSVAPINFTVVFSEAVTGFATGDVTLSGTAGATTATVSGSGTTYNVAVTGMSANGTVIATIAAGVAQSACSQPNAASTSTDNTVTWSTVCIPPTVDPVPNQQLCAGASTAPVNFTSTPPGATFAWTNSAPTIGLPASGTGNIASFVAVNNTAAPIVATISVTPTIGGTTAPVTIPLNGQTGTFPGSARGYFFTAPTAFTMTALRVPTDASAGNQHIAVVRFTPPAPPPAFPTTTNAFTTLFLTQNNATAGNIPVNIPIAAGDVIGILGTRGADINSYSAFPNVTTIAGFSVPLTRMGMQFPLATTAPTQLFQEATGAISRVFFDYTTGAAGGCSGPARTFTITVNPNPEVVIVADPGTTLCEGDPTLLTVRLGTSTPVGTLYTQGTTPVDGSPSQVFEPANAAFTSQAADDFTVPAGTTWTVTQVTANGIGAGVPTSVNVFIYNNSGSNLPGTAVASYNNLTTFTQAGGNYTVTLPSALSLASGTYWLSVQVNMSFATGGQWFWGNFGATNIGNEYAWQNPGGGFATPCTNWGYGSSGCGVGGGVNRNNVFSIIGSSLTGGGPLPPGYTFLWSPAAGLSSTTSNPVAASPMNTTTYTVVVTAPPGGPTACTRTASILITVNKRPTVTTQPLNQVACGNTTATFTAAGTGTGLTYQWQESVAGCAGPWVNLPNAAPYSGVNGPVLTISPVTPILSGRGYRLVLSGICAAVNGNNISNCAILTVNPAPNVAITPTGPVCGGVACMFGTMLSVGSAPPPVPGQVTVSSGTINVAVPDGDAVGVTTPITIAGIPANATITNISVTLNMPHTYPHDMIIGLKGPSGQILSLYKHNTNTTVFPPASIPTAGWFNAVVSKTASTVFSTVPDPYRYGITAPAGPYKADALNGTTSTGYTIQDQTGFVTNATNFDALYTTAASMNAAWTLGLCDGGAGDLGTLTSWSIKIDYTTPGTGGGPTLTYVWSPQTGLYTDAAACVPYTGTNTPVVYAAPTVLTVYTVTATDVATGCINTASVTVNYTPPPPTVTPNPVTMCLGDAAVKLKSSSSQTFTNTFNSGTVNVNIPDGPTIPPVPTTYPASTSNITVAGIPAGATITGVRARFNITHVYVGDLVMALKAPNGQIINLDAMLNKTNNPGANFTNTVISSTGSTLLSAGTAPFTNTYVADLAGATFTAFGFTFPGGPVGYVPTATTWAPLTPTSASANGVWSIGIYDAGAPDGGTLNNWSLDIDYTVGVVATAAVWTPAAGLFSDANALNAYVAGTAVDSVWARPTPAGVYNYDVTVKNIVGTNGTITTPMAGGNGNFLVAFNVKNNNLNPVTFSSISSNMFNSGTNVTTRVFYKPGGIAGNPGPISAANGWTQFGTATVPAVTANTLNLLISGMTLPIPAGATYGIAMDVSDPTGLITPAYTNGTGTIQTYSSGGVDLITDGNVGWGGPAAPGTPANNPRNFNGAISFVGAGPGTCVSPPRRVVVTVNTPTTISTQPVNQTICTDKVATFTVVAAGTGPFTYQWQVSTNSGNTWTNITNAGVYSGATTATLTITAPPVSMSGYLYRVVVNGAAPCAAATSFQAVLTVNPLPVIVITASPTTSLFPGMTTTLTSTVTPNAASIYTWLRNGITVPGATTGTLNVDIDGLGAYQLRVQDVNGCTNVSNIINITDSASAKCFIYPNPTSGVFQVRYHSVANNILPRTLTVYDAKGDRVFTQLYTIGRPYDRMDVDMRAYGKGLYWVEIGDRNGNRLTMCRVVIQ